MTVLQLLLIAFGPFLVVAPFALAAAREVDGFWGSGLRRPASVARVRLHSTGSVGFGCA